MQKNKNLTPFYAISFSAFILFAVVSIFVFFHFYRIAIRENAQDTIIESVDREQSHFATTIESQYEYLEGLAAYLGEIESDDLINEDSQQLVYSVAENSSFSLIALIDEDGTAWYSNDTTRNLSDREYFTESIEGERSLSSPVVSKADGATRVVLSVPIFSGDSVVGVLGGSYDIQALGDLLFNELYEGNGQFFIVSQEDGSVISQSGASIIELEAGDVIFDGIFNKDTNYRSVTTVTDDGTEKYSVSSWKEDVKAGESHLITMVKAKGSYYCYFESLGVSNWTLCYIVSVDDAHASYSQFTFYETRLFQVLAAGLFVLVLILIVVTFRKQKKLVHFAETDALTGINNKKAAEEYIKLWLADEACYGTQAFLMLDIDLFKHVNDGYGHAVGDAVLSAVGDGLREIFRESDIIGRLGGDEFGIFMKNATPEAAVERAEMVCQMVHSIKVDTAPTLSVSCSIGVALFPQHAKNFMDLYKKADKALYISKESGRDQYTLYDIRTME